jgi:AMP nucleosidase
MAVDMETATIFSVGFYNEIPSGALLLVSDQPMISSGVKTTESDNEVSRKFIQDHLKIGIDSLLQISQNKKSVKHLKYM